MVLAKTIKLGIQIKGTGKAVGKKTPKEKTSPFLTKAPQAKTVKGDPKQDVAKEIMQEIAFFGAPAGAVGMKLDEASKKNKGKKIKKPKKKIPGLKGKK
tara:strand:+ start:284 stop:580 length:297 start_codon:yes stop_codon:yes gene_type:complete